jgi:hypothetical protein
MCCASCREPASARGGLARPHERGHHTAVDRGRQVLDRESRGAEEGARVLEPIDPDGLDGTALEADLRQQREELGLRQRGRDASDPQLQAAPELDRQATPGHMSI